MDSNALVCDCEMMWLVQMLKDKLKGTQAAATCQYPIAMKGKSLTSMTETDFHCSEYDMYIEAPASVTCLPPSQYSFIGDVVVGLCCQLSEL